MPRIPTFHSLSLLAGALLVGVAGARHPLLSGDGAAQLGDIAAASGWRGIHLALVFGMILVVAGLVGVALRHGETAGSAAARAGVVLGVLGYGTALVGVLFMTGSAAHLAETYAAAGPSLTGTQAVFVYDMLRPFAAMALRAGEFAIGLAIWSLGWGVVDGGVLPRWLGRFGVAAGVVCAVWAVVINEHAAMLMGGMALVTVWQVVVAGVMAGREAKGGR
jgi:hypothetical protein